MKTLTRSAAGLLASLVLAAPPALAQTTSSPVILGLGTITGPNFRGASVGSQGVVQIDPITGTALNLGPVTITGVTAGQTLAGIDYRPANNLLYALGYDGSTAGNNTQLYTLNLTSSVATAVGSAIRLSLGTAADRIGFDFNPVADRIRVTSTNRADYRLDPTTGSLVATDGTLTYAAGTAAASLVPQVATVAYANSFAGSTTTALYDLDYRNTIAGARNGVLAQQAPPNAGTLDSLRSMSFVITGGASPGTYGIGQPDALGLDIYYDPTTNQNVGYLTEVTAPRTSGANAGTRASNTYRLNLKTGQATQLGNTVPANAALNFEIRDLAVAPALAPVTATAPAALAQLASVFPNPAHGTAALLLPLALRGTAPTVVQVLDPLGRVVLTRTLVGSTELVDLPLGGLAPGIYSVQAHTNAGVVVKRLVVE